MSATKVTHTAGPWHSMIVGSHWVALEMPPRAGQHVALMTELPEAEANARLIAAAPELLEALKECRAIVYLQNGNLHDDINEIIERATAAIRKAEGE